jgi:hypothetical protein
VADYRASLLVDSLDAEPDVGTTEDLWRDGLSCHFLRDDRATAISETTQRNATTSIHRFDMRHSSQAPSEAQFMAQRQVSACHAMTSLVAA